MLPASLQSLLCFFLVFATLLVFSSACGSAQEGAQLKLDQARERYRISKVAEEQLAAELEALKKTETTTPEMIRNYEQYLDRSQAMTLENQSVVRDLEAAYSRGRQPRKAAPAAEALPGTTLSGVPIPEEQGLDPLENLDRRLDDSLAEFDQTLLKEMDEILEKSRDRIKNLAEEAAAAAENLKQQSAGKDGGTKGTQQEQSGEGTASAAAPGETPPGQAPGDRQSATGEQRPGGGSIAGKPGDTGSGRPSGISSQDDDVVARQLREAAETETDPALKKKLWQEYENYKKGTGQ
ncbi:MAG: hypothetical protein GY868_20985 [Deltaproteobacteria bacterium]|nr:hypothetical protein [Deltaproteobacteria bacterium]